jgi:acylphosphatase
VTVPEGVPGPDEAVVRCHVVVAGRVQNVTYRDSTRQQAEERGLAGWVRNLPDGSVEAELQGPRAAVEEVLAWMHQGPLLAGVDAVEVSVVPPNGEESFAVR